MVIKNPRPYKAIQRPFTRNSKVRSKAYIKALPQTAVVKFVMGNSSKFNAGKYSYTIRVISKEDAQIRDVSLEAIRSQIHRHLETEVGTDYYLAVSVYPHHVLREHKQAAVAQADRMSQGMSLSFGKSVGKAAQVFVGKPILILAFNTESDVNKFREIYRRVKPKICMKTSLEITKK